jgi:hypothetical protein
MTAIWYISTFFIMLFVFYGIGYWYHQATTVGMTLGDKQGTKMLVILSAIYAAITTWPCGIFLYLILSKYL